MIFDRRDLVCINPLNTDGSVITALTKGEVEYKFGRARKCLVSLIVFIRILNLIHADDSDLYINAQKEKNRGAERIFSFD